MGPDSRGHLSPCRGALSFLVFSFLAAAGKEDEVARKNRRFYISNDQFMKDDEPINIRASSLHYFRVPPLYWRDRMQRYKALGLNAISAYVAWNFHEEVEGEFHHLDMISSFLDVAHEEGLMVILRPGPYICGEWDFGGLPSFLLAKPGIKLRTYNGPYLDAVNRWFEKLFGTIASKAYSKGGPIIAVQIENEYGSFGYCDTNSDDAKYMDHLYNLTHSHFGPDILYTTIDGGEDYAGRVIRRGNPWPRNPKVFATVDGALAFDYSKKWGSQKKFNAPGNSPKMWSELWTGWFAVWGDGHAPNMSAFHTSIFNGLFSRLLGQRNLRWSQTTNGDNIMFGAVSFREGMQRMVDDGGSFSMYMAHGGTNFGFWNGANGNLKANGPASFEPDITSYDYSGPISEAGDHNIGSDGGDLFVAIRDAISSKYGEPAEEPAPIMKVAYGKIALTESAHLFANLDRLQTCSHVVEANTSFPTFEGLGQSSGFVVYSRTPFNDKDSFAEATLNFNSYTLHDRVQVFVDGAVVGTADRRDGISSISIPRGDKMSFLVENMGRINYGQAMYDYKGLLMKPPVAGNWMAYCLPLGTASLRRIRFSTGIKFKDGEPVFRRGTLQVKGTPNDTFLDTDGLTKGVMWVNGHNLGRYWATRGPQYTLYLPAPYLQSGDNEVIVFDLEGSSAKEIKSVAAPRYLNDHTQVFAIIVTTGLIVFFLLAASCCFCCCRRRSRFRACIVSSYRRCWISRAKVLARSDRTKSDSAQSLLGGTTAPMA